MTEDASATSAHVEDIVEGKTFEFRYPQHIRMTVDLLRIPHPL